MIMDVDMNGDKDDCEDGNGGDQDGGQNIGQDSVWW